MSRNNYFVFILNLSGRMWSAAIILDGSDRFKWPHVVVSGYRVTVTDVSGRMRSAALILEDSYRER